jgi:hypothetical protein
MIVDDVFTRYWEHIIAFSPVAATQLGDHRRDGDLDDWPPGTTDARLRDLGHLRRALDDLTPECDERVWSQAEADGDRTMLADALDAQRFTLEELRSHERDPMVWLGLATTGVYELVRRDDLDPAPRRAAAVSRSAQVPRLLQQARKTLRDISAPHRDVALQRIPGAVALFRVILPAFAPEAGECGEAAARACEAFGRWLLDTTSPSPGWRLGEERWAAALRLRKGMPVPAEKVWDRGWAALEALQAEAEEAAVEVLGASRGLVGPELVRAGLEVVVADRPTRESLVPQAAAVLPEIVAFLRESSAFPISDPRALRVEELPRFLQGVAGAYLFPAPPLEPSASHRYCLSPVPEGWDDERAASFLREHNRAALYALGMHEAFPGHYVQFVHARAHPRLLRRVLENEAFVEGWAVYAERQLVAAGFGTAALNLISAKLAMRVAANALLDQGLHVHGWDDDTALELMIRRAYQERAEALSKLVRGKVSAGQLSNYFIGGQEMADLRRDAEALPDFEAARFHRDVLAHGSPPFPVLRHALGL